MEEARVEKINNLAGKYLKEILETIDDETSDQYDDFIAKTYAHMIVASYVGYSLEFLMEDALIVANNITKLIKEAEDADSNSSAD